MANHPHNSKRPESKATMDAVNKADMTALERALSPMQLGFCREYCIDFNATAAAIRAGYSPKNAGQQGSLLLKNLGVKRFIEHLTATKEAKLISVNPDYVIQGLTSILSQEGARNGDKIRIYELLAKHLGMLSDKIELTGKDGEAIRIEQQKINEEANDFINAIKGMAKKKDVTLI